MDDIGHAARNPDPDTAPAQVPARRNTPRALASTLPGVRGNRMRTKGHYMSGMPFLYGARYITCDVPGCSRVRRAWNLKPLIHKGRKARRG